MFQQPEQKLNDVISQKLLSVESMTDPGKLVY